MGQVTPLAMYIVRDTAEINPVLPTDWDNYEKVRKYCEKLTMQYERPFVIYVAGINTRGHWYEERANMAY